MYNYSLSLAMSLVLMFFTKLTRSWISQTFNADDLRLASWFLSSEFFLFRWIQKDLMESKLDFDLRIMLKYVIRVWDLVVISYDFRYIDWVTSKTALSCKWTRDSWHFITFAMNYNPFHIYMYICNVKKSAL